MPPSPQLVRIRENLAGFPLARPVEASEAAPETDSEASGEISDVSTPPSPAARSSPARSSPSDQLARLRTNLALLGPSRAGDGEASGEFSHVITRIISPQNIRLHHPLLNHRTFRPTHHRHSQTRVAVAVWLGCGVRSAMAQHHCFSHAIALEGRVR